MSVQFGRWNFNRDPVNREFLALAESSITPYGPDGGGSYSDPGIDILYRAFHTTSESRLETQPLVSSHGDVIAWDGRLDNRDELVRELGDAPASSVTELDIIAHAWERWRCDLFAKLLGDWAISIWNPHDHSLVLAKDTIGARHLYYSLDQDGVTWSTILDPLVLGRRRVSLDLEYIAGWLRYFPATHLTPYAEIQSVPASSFVLVRPGARSTVKYWDFDRANKVRYRTDADYEEHFREVFARSVRRRLRSQAPILAELSGGVDSSSIVCVADTLIARGGAETPALHTVSYYDDSEPNWNERPYFAAVEARRGRTGRHINVGLDEWSLWRPEIGRFAATPASAGPPTRAAKQSLDQMMSQGERVLLSGIGGDEVTGGVPAPTPELADRLAQAQLKMLAHRLKSWALVKRKPWFHLLLETVREFFPRALLGDAHYKRLLWLDSGFAMRYRNALTGYPRRLKLFGPMPSFQESLRALDGLRRQIACSTLSPEWPYEKRYPFLDRDLLEFLCAVPREQLVRPGQRRSLIRRALSGMVPNEILHRARKAYVTRAPRRAISLESVALIEMSQNMLSSSLGVVDASAYRQALERARNGQEVAVLPLLRTAGIEMWLRNLAHWNLLDAVEAEVSKQHILQAETQPSGRETSFS
jgi:asparagine synthase (glutamine-hydrolysing)